jgi:hypothetical protein
VIRLDRDLEYQDKYLIEMLPLYVGLKRRSKNKTIKYIEK